MYLCAHGGHCAYYAVVKLSVMCTWARERLRDCRGPRRQYKQCGHKRGAQLHPGLTWEACTIPLRWCLWLPDWRAVHCENTRPTLRGPAEPLNTLRRPPGAGGAQGNFDGKAVHTRIFLISLNIRGRTSDHATQPACSESQWWNRVAVGGSQCPRRDCLDLRHQAHPTAACACRESCDHERQSFVSGKSRE